ncbi:MAG: tetratricopeptide repeat protein [Firmicutes bacterium]|nr:tetratricopeptide repeat protein [Bacillota bacterium]
MICAYCGGEEKDGVCTSCGTDVVFAAKVYNLAVRYFNKGLMYANEGRYTDACHALRKSVSFRKDNVKAQNLLGLVYQRVGAVTQAFKAWQFSCLLDEDKKENPAFYYIEELKKDNFEAKVRAVKNYNIALKHFREGNTDLTLVALKKAIEDNKYFVQAHNLKTLCHIGRNENREALAGVNRVLKMDKDNEKALCYLKYLKPDKFKPFEQKEPDIREKSETSPVNVVYSSRGRFMGFILGVVLCGVVCGVLIIPSVVKRSKDLYKDSELKYSIDIASREEKLASDAQTIEQLNAEIDVLRARIYTSDEQELEKRVQTLNDIKKIYDSGNPGAAADKLLLLDPRGFSEQAVNQYRSLCFSVLPAAAKSYYDLGETARNRGDRESAVAFYQKCIRCATQNEEVKYSAQYQLARMANADGDIETAKKYYNEVALNHPLSNIRSEASKYLSEH